MFECNSLNPDLAQVSLDGLKYLSGLVNCFKRLLFGSGSLIGALDDFAST